MANHTITLVNQMSNQGGNQSNINRVSSNASSRRVAQSNSPRRVVTGINKQTRQNDDTILGGLGIKIGGAIALTTVAVATVKKGINVYSKYMEAKSGETMKYQNIRQVTNFITNPASMAKKLIWDYGILAPMENRRQNIGLNYQRELTGNIIYSKYYENGQF